MLLDLKKIAIEHSFKINGIIHAGSHEAQERNIYAEMGISEVAWIEANPEVAKRLNGALPNNHKVINALITDKDGEFYDFNLSSNEQSSSIFQFGTHAKDHPDVVYTGKKRLQSVTLDTLIDLEAFDIRKYNFFLADIQGAELLALKGFIKNLKFIDYIYLEVNIGEVYKGCAKLEELDEFLSKQGFKRIEALITDAAWGDAIWKRV